MLNVEEKYDHIFFDKCDVLFHDNDNDGNMESEWELALNEDKSTSYNKREIN